MRIIIDGKPEEIKKLFSSCNTKQSGRPLSSEERKKIWKDAAKKLTKWQEKLIKKLLNAISGSKEQLHQIASDTSYLRERFPSFDRKAYLEKVKRITEDL